MQRQRYYNYKGRGRRAAQMKERGWVRFKVIFKHNDYVFEQVQLCFVLAFPSSQIALVFSSFLTHLWYYQRGVNRRSLAVFI